MRNRPGFNILESLVTIGVIAATATMSVPLIRNAQIKSDLKIGVEQTILGLRIAQTNARNGQNNTDWGLYISTTVDGAVLYEGSSYTGDSVQHFPFTTNVLIQGLTDISFSSIIAAPSGTGGILFTAPNDDQALINVNEKGGLSTVWYIN